MASRTSGGTSIAAGRGRPERIRAIAWSTSAGISSGRMARPDHFTTERSISSWFGISCRSPRPESIRSERTCPATQSTGDEQA